MNCKIDECFRKARSRGFCSMHYNRWRRTGNPSVKGVANFKGNNARYLAVHVRLRKMYGQPNIHLCISCFKPATEWAYLHLGEIKYDFVGGVTVPYSTNLDHYGPMCGSCHTRMDKGR